MVEKENIIIAVIVIIIMVFVLWYMFTDSSFFDTHISEYWG